MKKNAILEKVPAVFLAHSNNRLNFAATTKLLVWISLTYFYTLFYFKFIEGRNNNDEHFWTHLLQSPAISNWQGHTFEIVGLNRPSDRRAWFAYETHTRKSAVITFITTFGIMPNQYADVAQSQLTKDSLFV